MQTHPLKRGLREEAGGRVGAEVTAPNRLTSGRKRGPAGLVSWHSGASRLGPPAALQLRR